MAGRPLRRARMRNPNEYTKAAYPYEVFYQRQIGRKVVSGSVPVASKAEAEACVRGMKRSPDIIEAFIRRRNPSLLTLAALGGVGYALLHKPAAKPATHSYAHQREVRHHGQKPPTPSRDMSRESKRWLVWSYTPETGWYESVPRKSYQSAMASGIWQASYEDDPKYAVQEYRNGAWMPATVVNRPLGGWKPKGDPDKLRNPRLLTVEDLSYAPIGAVLVTVDGNLAFRKVSSKGWRRQKPVAGGQWADAGASSPKEDQQQFLRLIPMLARESFVLQAGTQRNPAVVPDCAWCGGECFKQYLNKRGEVFCSPAHRSASNRALARLPSRNPSRLVRNPYLQKFIPPGGKGYQYVYSEEDVAKRHAKKAQRIESLKSKEASLRAAVKRGVEDGDDAALAVGLILATYERPGNSESAREGHYGVTGWECRHLTVGKRSATIDYIAKSGVHQTKTITEPYLVRALAEKQAECGRKGSRLVAVSASAVNRYLDSFDVSAKDLRTFGANTEMQRELTRARASGPDLSTLKARDVAKTLKAEFNAALGVVAGRLGHTTSVLRKQYLVQGIEPLYLESGAVLKTFA